VRLLLSFSPYQRDGWRHILHEQGLALCRKRIGNVWQDQVEVHLNGGELPEQVRTLLDRTCPNCRSKFELMLEGALLV
jgi:hypothetical protein